jgi:hypothetical protein
MKVKIGTEAMKVNRLTVSVPCSQTREQLTIYVDALIEEAQARGATCSLPLEIPSQIERAEVFTRDGFIVRYLQAWNAVKNEFVARMDLQYQEAA